jgi:hypothetical protein
MKDMIVIRALENGQWEIKVLVNKSANELIERSKVCKI